jgi:hypothetical protein
MKRNNVRTPLLALAIAGALLSLGSQDSCNTVGNVGLVPAASTSRRSATALL